MGTRVRDGGITFSDLVGKLDELTVECAKCWRRDCYSLRRLLEQQGPNGKLTDWKDELIANCPYRLARNFKDQCGAHLPDLKALEAAQFPKKPPAKSIRRRAAQKREAG